MLLEDNRLVWSTGDAEQLVADGDGHFKRSASRKKLFYSVHIIQSYCRHLFYSHRLDHYLDTFLAVPILVLSTFAANFRLVRVSLRCSFSGLTMTNISVLELPPSEYCSRYVN